MNGMADSAWPQGPWPRSHKIRLVTRIDNGSSFPRISPSSYNKLAPPQRRLKPRTPLHRAPQYRLELQRLLALQHGLELRNTIRSTPPQANPPTAVPRAAAMAAAPAQHRSLEQLQRPRPPATLWTEAKAPRAAVPKPHQLQANFDLNIGDADHGPRHFSSDRAPRPQSRDADGRRCWWQSRPARK